MHNYHQQSVASTLGASPNQQSFRKRLSFRRHRIDLANQFIKVNKNQLQFSNLSPSVKYFFIQTYKKCAVSQCLGRIFKPNEDNSATIKVPRSIELKDTDALQLIYKMMKEYIKQKVHKKLRNLKLLLQQKSGKLQRCDSFQQEIKNKVVLINNLLQMSEPSQIESLEKIQIQLKEQLNQIIVKEIKLKEQIEQIQKYIKVHDRVINFEQSSAQITQMTNKTISKITRNLIKETILSIVEDSSNQVKSLNNGEIYVIFEQSYHTIKIKKQDLIKLISSQTYMQKIKRFTFINSKTSSQEENLSILCCHRCMQIMSADKLNVCQKIITKRQTSSYTSTDALLFRTVILESDHFSQQAAQHVLPYFVYNFDQNGQICCNRAFCNDCLVNFYRMNPQTFNCPYCAGICNCRRCQMAVSLVKLMAYDSINKQNYEQRNYHNTLNLFSNHQSKYVLACLNIRKAKKNDKISQIAFKNHSKKSVQVNFNFTNKQELTILQESLTIEVPLYPSDSKKEEAFPIESGLKQKEAYEEDYLQEIFAGSGQVLNWNLNGVFQESEK